MIQGIQSKVQPAMQKHKQDVSAYWQPQKRAVAGVEVMSRSVRRPRKNQPTCDNSRWEIRHKDRTLASGAFATGEPGSRVDTEQRAVSRRAGQGSRQPTSQAGTLLGKTEDKSSNYEKGRSSPATIEGAITVQNTALPSAEPSQRGNGIAT